MNDFHDPCAVSSIELNKPCRRERFAWCKAGFVNCLICSYFEHLPSCCPNVVIPATSILVSLSNSILAPLYKTVPMSLLLLFYSSSQCQIPLQRLLFSATLTHNPEKLQQLGLYQPRLFSSIHQQPRKETAKDQDEPLSSGNFSLPQGLTVSYSTGT